MQYSFYQLPTIGTSPASPNVIQESAEVMIGAPQATHVPVPG